MCNRLTSYMEKYDLFPYFYRNYKLKQASNQKVYCCQLAKFFVLLFTQADRSIKVYNKYNNICKFLKSIINQDSY